MMQLDRLAAIDFEGRDARDFLHRQLSADILGLTPGQATFACLCVPKGRVVALLLVQATPSGTRALCSAALADTVTSGLQRFVFRDDVRITRVQDQAVFGATEAAEGRMLTPVGLSYRLDAPGSAPPDDGAFHREELAAGVVWLDEDTREGFLPQALGYERIGALNFRKGCYPGQEIVARTRYLGRLKRRAVLLELGGAPGIRSMARLQLSGAGQDVAADLVDASAGLWFAVARTADAFDVDTVSVDNEQWAVERAEWAPPAQASATT